MKRESEVQKHWLEHFFSVWGLKVVKIFEKNIQSAYFGCFLCIEIGDLEVKMNLETGQLNIFNLEICV